MNNSLDNLFTINGIIYAFLYTWYKNPFNDNIFMIYISVNFLCYFYFGGYLYNLMPNYSKILFDFIMIFYNTYLLEHNIHNLP